MLDVTNVILITVQNATIITLTQKMFKSTLAMKKVLRLEKVFDKLVVHRRKFLVAAIIAAFIPFFGLITYFFVVSIFLYYANFKFNPKNTTVIVLLFFILFGIQSELHANGIILLILTLLGVGYIIYLYKTLAHVMKKKISIETTQVRRELKTSTKKSITQTTFSQNSSYSHNNDLLNKISKTKNNIRSLKDSLQYLAGSEFLNHVGSKDMQKGTTFFSAYKITEIVNTSDRVISDLKEIDQTTTNNLKFRTNLLVGTKLADLGSKLGILQKEIPDRYALVGLITEISLYIKELDAIQLNLENIERNI